ncbi:MAG: insulinase family protein [Ilumatobacteraceae bacterium]
MTDEGRDDGDVPTAPPVATSTTPFGDVALPGLLDDSNETIPDDADVRTGVLDNGLTYYVRRNDNPGSKVTLNLAIDAGSVDELGDADGLAHFLEHMLFNGTTAFPENRLIDVLRGFGADFGPDVNASTGFDRTVYELVVPNDARSVALGISVLEEWLSSATIAPAEVVKERGVVLDEWRVRTQTTQGRLSEVAEALFLDGSAYAGRSPIGTRASIESMDHAEVREFYDAWYRPDNAAIIVVGDIDADGVVGEIADAFGSVTARGTVPPTRPDVSFRIDTEPDFGLHVDPDQQTVDVEVSLPIPSDVETGTRAARTTLLDSMIYGALVRRLDLDAAAGTAPFDEILRGGNSIVATLDAPALYAITDGDRVVETLTTLLDEYERAFQFGFTDAETALVRQTLQSSLDTRYEGRESRQDGDIANALVDAFLTGADYPTIADEYGVLSGLLNDITPAALDLRFRARWGNSAPHVIVSTPEAVADRIPNRAEVLELIDAARSRPLLRRSVSRELPDALMERPAPVDAVSSEPLLDTGVPIFDPQIVIFPNGATVVLSPNSIVEGQVFLRAASPGGSSQVADADVVDSLYAADVVMSGGVADFNEAELAEIDADADVAISASITPYEDSFRGAVASGDVEVLFQLLHLYFVQPRFDPVALDRVRARERPVVHDPGSDPDAAGTDALLDARYHDALRYTLVPTPEQFETLDLAGVERVWTERHADAGDWTFIIGGDFDVQAVTELAAAYVATLPATGTAEGFVDLEIALPAEPRRVVIEAGSGDTATVAMLFSTPASGAYVDDRVEADVASEVLSARLTRVVREELGDSYSPIAVSYVTPDPDPVIETYVRISGSPDRIDAIAGVVLDEFADLAAGGMSADEFDRAFALIVERYNFVDNDLFLDGIAQGQVFPELGIDSFLDRLGRLDAIGRDEITAFIASHVPLDRFVQVTVVPR